MRYMTAGELRGRDFVAIVADVPAGLRLSADAIDADLDRWACCCPGAREGVDRVSIVSGISGGRTTGAPVALALDNAAFAASVPAGAGAVPRPGSADLSASLATDADDCCAAAERDVMRACAMRVAASGVAREFLAALGVEVHSYVTRIGAAAMREEPAAFEGLVYTPLSIETSSVRCPSAASTRMMESAMAAARAAGDTLDGEFALVACGVVAGLGGVPASGATMSAALAAAAFSAPGVTGVAFGSAAHGDCSGHAAIARDAKRGFLRSGNASGGIEGGITTGMPIVMRASVAASPSLGRAVDSIDAETLAPAKAEPSVYEPCIAGASAVVAEAEIAFALAAAYQARFGGACMTDALAAHKAYERRLKLAAR